MFTEIIYALVLQSYAVEHSPCCLCHTRIVVALTWFECCSLDDDTTNLTEINEVGKLQSVAKGT